MNIYKRHRFPSEIICYAVWLYYRFNLSHRDVEDLLAQRGITVSYESIRLWCNKFGPKYARPLKRKHRGYGDTFFIDEVFVKIGGKQFYLWRTVDQDGEVVDVFLQTQRDGKTARRFFKRLLRSYGVAHRELMPEVIHDKSQYANNRAAVSHQPTRLRERGMRRFKSISQAQRFLDLHATVYNLFNLGRHLVSAEQYRCLRKDAFGLWIETAA